MFPCPYGLSPIVHSFRGLVLCYSGVYVKYTFVRKTALKYTFAYTSRDKEYAICYNEPRTMRSRDFIAVQSCGCIRQTNKIRKGLDSWQIFRLTMQVAMAGRSEGSFGRALCESRRRLPPDLYKCGGSFSRRFCRGFCLSKVSFLRRKIFYDLRLDLRFVW